MTSLHKACATVAALVLLAACGSDTSVSESAVVTEAPAPDETTAEPSETAAETEAAVETTEAAVETTEAPEEPKELTSIGKSGFSTYDASGELWASAGALIVNNSDEDLFGTQVTFNVIGADGTPVATESTYVDVIPAGDSFPAVIDVYTDLTAAMPVTLEITAFAETDSFLESDWVEMELGPTTVVPDEYFTNVTGTVTNPADVPFDFFAITCLVVTADGSIVGGALTYPDQVAPAQTIAWEASVQDGSIQAGGVAAECRSIATITG